MIKSPLTKLFTFLLALSLLNSSLATAMISPLASLGGNIQIGGKKQTQADLAKQGINTDATQTQKLTKNQQTGGLDATVTVDHRLASEQGRLSIAKDFVDTALHADEIGRAVTDAVENKNLSSLPSNIHHYATERNVLAQKAADKNTQDKLKGEQDAEGSQAGLQDLSDALSDAQGLDKKANVSVYDGSQVKDDTQVNDSTGVNKQQALAAYNQKGNGIHVNTDRTDMSNSQSTVATLVHEQTRHRQAQEGNQQSREQQTYTAQRHGDRAGTVWGIYSKLNGHSTQGSRSHQQWQQQNSQNNVIQHGNRTISQINNKDLKARQFTPEEANILDKARTAINQQDISNEAKQTKLKQLQALSYAQVNAADGVAEKDPEFTNIKAINDKGDKLNQQGNNLYAMLDELGVSSQVETGGNRKKGIKYKKTKKAFGYTALNKADDVVGKHDLAVGRTKSAVKGAAGTAMMAGGATMCTSGVLCGVGALTTTAGASQVVDSYNELTSEYQYKNGSNLKASESANMHNGNGSHLGSAAVDVGVAAAEATVAGKVAKTSDNAYNATKGWFGSKPKPAKTEGKNQNIHPDLNIGKNNPNHKPEVHANINKRAEIETAHNDAKAQNWKKDGKPIYPNNKKGYDALPGTQKKHTIQKGDVLARYVSKKDINKHHNGKYDPSIDITGRYTAPENVPFDKRAMPSKESDYELFKFKVKKPIESDRSKATPWFDKKGRGNQDHHKPISELIDEHVELMK